MKANTKVYENVLIFCRKCWKFSCLRSLPDPSEETQLTFVNLVLFSLRQENFRGKSAVSLQVVCSDVFLGTLTDTGDSFLARYFFLNCGTDLLLAFCFNSNANLRGNFSKILAFGFCRNYLPDAQKDLAWSSLKACLSQDDLIGELHSLMGSLLAVSEILSSTADDSKTNDLNVIVKCFTVCLQGSRSELVKVALTGLMKFIHRGVLFDCDNEILFCGYGYDSIARLLQDIMRKFFKESDVVELTLECLAALSKGLASLHSFTALIDELLMFCFASQNARSTDIVFQYGLIMVALCPRITLNMLLRSCISVASSASPIVLKNVGIWIVIILNSPDMIISDLLLVDEIHSLLTKMLSGSLLVQEVAFKIYLFLFDKSSPGIRAEVIRKLYGTLNSIVTRPAFVGAADDSKERKENDSSHSVRSLFELSLVARDLGAIDCLIFMLDLCTQHNFWLQPRVSSLIPFHLSIAKLCEFVCQDLSRNIGKLYLYQHHPDVLVARVMKYVWGYSNSSQNCMDYMDNVFSLLTKRLVDPQPEIRQASCKALSEFAGISIERMRHFLVSILENVFNVLDDVDDKVRAGAVALGKSCLNWIEKISEMNLENLDDLISLIVEKGFDSKVAEIRNFSVNAILSISKVSVAPLKSFMANMVKICLESLSSNESSDLQYAMHHTESFNVTKADLELMRVSLAASSPVAELLNKLLDNIDPENINNVLVSLIEILRYGVGLATLCSTANYLRIIIDKFPFFVKPFAPKIMDILVVGLKDDSTSLRVSYCRALGGICQISEQLSVEELFNRLFKVYVSSGDAEARFKISTDLELILRNSKAAADGWLGFLVPWIWLGMHDVSSDSRNIFNTIASDLSLGKRTMMDKFLPTIVDVVMDILMNSMVYDVRASACVSANDICQIHKFDNFGRLEPFVGGFIGVFVKLMGFKRWQGIEHVIVAATSFCDTFHASIYEQHIRELFQLAFEIQSSIHSEDDCEVLTSATQLSIILFRHGFEYLAETFCDWVEAMEAICGECWQSWRKSEPVLIAFYEGLGVIPLQDDQVSQTVFSPPARTALFSGLSHGNFRVRASCLQSIKLVVQRVSFRDESEMKENVTALYFKMLALFDDKYEIVRSESFHLLSVLSKSQYSSAFNQNMRETIISIIVQHEKEDRSSLVQSALGQFREVHSQH